MSQEYNIRIGSHISELEGIGTEYLIIDEKIVAKFYNGNIMESDSNVDSKEKTLDLSK